VVAGPADRLAARVARDGDPEAILIEETAASFTIGWTGRYRIDGPCSCTLTANPAAS